MHQLSPDVDTLLLGAEIHFAQLAPYHPTWGVRLLSAWAMRAFDFASPYGVQRTPRAIAGDTLRFHDAGMAFPYSPTRHHGARQTLGVNVLAPTAE